MERLIKEQAILLAGAFYERNRSDQFRRAFPTVQHYLDGYQVVTDGAVKKTPRGWMHHVVLARRLLVELLNQPESRITTFMKNEIVEALIRDRGRAAKYGLRVHQRMSKDDGEKSARPAAG